MKFRPVKGRRLDQRLAGEAFEPALEDYVRQRNTAALVVNIESTPALEALDEILAVPDLDAVLIGPHDLSCSLGMPEQYDRPEFLAACETIFRKARAAGVAAGIHSWGGVEAQARYFECGASFLIHSGDITLFQKCLRQEAQRPESGPANRPAGPRSGTVHLCLTASLPSFGHKVR